MTSRPSIAAPILAVLAIVLVTLGAYVGGYFWLGEYTLVKNEFILREFPYSWQAKSFWLAGQVESLLTRSEVHLYPSDNFVRGTQVRMPVDTPIEPISDEELDWIVEQWADFEGVEVSEEWEAIKMAPRAEDEKP